MVRVCARMHACQVPNRAHVHGATRRGEGGRGEAWRDEPVLRFVGGLELFEENAAERHGLLFLFLRECGGAANCEDGDEH